ncbi:MAG: Hpt domain-containing protein [Pseudomonadales bacterium]
MPDLIDPAVVAELKDLMAGDLEALLQAFRDDSQARLAVARRSWAAGDLAELRSQAHSLKGAAANLGVAGLAAACQGLESAARHGDADAVSSALDLVGELLNASHEAFQRPPYRDA